MINRHASDCRCCTTPAQPEPEQQQIQLPDEPTPIRVHKAGLPPFDCTLHPDGTLTALLGGELRRNFMSFDDMRERNWQHARIEFNPPPLDTEPQPADEPGPVQDAIPLDA